MADPPLRVRGDFQTPLDLAKEVWAALGNLGEVGGIIEPTVGTGAFLLAAPTELRARPWVCFDINADYVDRASAGAKASGFQNFRVERGDAFMLSPKSLDGLDREQPLLAIGNPPWVTSSGQGSFKSRNLPAKSNKDFGLKGLDALTGKSNFDIAEAILLRLLDAAAEFKEFRMAFLIKRTVAMKLSRRLLGSVSELSFSQIDAKAYFGVAVDAGLFIVRRAASGQRRAAHVDIATSIGGPAVKRAGFYEDRFVEDLDAHATAAHLEATEPVPWRQGIKHDLAKILELTPCAGGLRNGFDETVAIEADLLCPLYKSSDVANRRPARRVFPLFQKDLSGPLRDLDSRWPMLAAYLHRHTSYFDARRSKIYSGKPQFSIFGIGPYALAPWKVAISGLYPSGRFCVLGPAENGQPSLVDDTCYLLPFENEHSARTVADHLNGPEAQRLLQTLINPGSKRPITKAVLSRIEVPIRPSEEQGNPQAAMSLLMSA